MSASQHKTTSDSDLNAVKRSNLRTGKINGLLRGGLKARKLLRSFTTSAQTEWTKLQYILLCLAVRRTDLVSSLFLDEGLRINITITFEASVSAERMLIIWSQTGEDCHFVFPNISMDQTGLAICARWWALRPLFQEMIIGLAIHRLPVNLGDASTQNGVAFCSCTNDVLLIPDCDFLNSEGYAETRLFFSKEQTPWDQRSNVAFWRGTSTGMVPEDGMLPRVKLCLLAKEIPDLLDCGITGFVQLSAIDQERLAALDIKKDFVSWRELVNIKYHIDIDGNSSAWSALFKKMLSGGLVFKVDSPGSYRQWYYHLLNPWINYIPVAADLSNLEDLLRFFRDNDALASSIAANGRRLAQTLTYTSQIKAARETIEKYSIIKGYKEWQNQLFSCTGGSKSVEETSIVTAAAKSEPRDETCLRRERSRVLKRHKRRRSSNMPEWHNSLEALGRTAGTDKSMIEHGFLDFYEEELSNFRDQKFVLMEIGVKHGASLRMWATWFQYAIAVGLDVDESAASVSRPPNAHVRIGDANDVRFLETVVAEFGRPSIVVDDGSHVWPHQLTSLHYFWPLIAAGGCFIMEDLHTSFPALEEGFRYGGQVNPFEHLQKLNRWVVGNRFMGNEQPDCDFVATAWPTVASMHFARGTCVIHKLGS